MGKVKRAILVAENKERLRKHIEDNPSFKAVEAKVYCIKRYLKEIKEYLYLLEGELGHINKEVAYCPKLNTSVVFNKDNNYVTYFKNRLILVANNNLPTDTNKYLSIILTIGKSSSIHIRMGADDTVFTGGVDFEELKHTVDGNTVYSITQDNYYQLPIDSFNATNLCDFLRDFVDFLADIYVDVEDFIAKAVSKAIAYEYWQQEDEEMEEEYGDDL